MITAKFLTGDDGSIRMAIRGHAGTAPAGEDLVCAAATMLAYTVAQAAQFMYEQGQLQDKPKVRISSGRATVVVKPKEDHYAACLHTFWVAQCGIHVLVRNYPKNVRLEHLTV